jgi:adenylate kinase family enzyme
VSELLSRERRTTLYVSATVSNQGRFYRQFDAVVLLSAPRDVILRRIDLRTTNDYGKTTEQRRRIIGEMTDVEPLLRATCTHEIDATKSLADVVAELIAIGGEA